jgi:hypothetical protein
MAKAYRPVTELLGALKGGLAGTPVPVTHIQLGGVKLAHGVLSSAVLEGLSLGSR